MSKRITTALALVAIAPAMLLAACSSSSDGTSAPTASTTIAVAATDTTCTLDSSSVPAGAVAFEVTNTGNEITEVYVYGRSGDAFTTVVAEVENIGPGVTRDMSADLAAGDYEIACKPGQTGSGIRTPLVVTGEASTPAASASVAAREIALAIGADDQLTGVEGQSAAVGERIEFAVMNGAAADRIFEVKRPDGTVAGEVEIKPSVEADLYIDTNVAGTWKLIVEGGPTETEVGFTVK
ncbi:MAG: cupredoxin domain-containing protein [Candidatus Nanopelagicales bacterium]|nr:cupredoxin domain-containing protein [Candidatus Nanopelagicales bacterium]